MATYTERVELKEEILPDQTIQLRVATVIERDGEEVGRQYHRSVFTPGADLSEAPDEVKTIAEVRSGRLLLLVLMKQALKYRNLKHQLLQTKKLIR